MAKYRLQRYEVSTDNGVTWTPVTPEQFRKGELLDNNVGCETVEWRIVDGEYICDEAGNPTVTVLASGVINTGDCTSNVFNDIASLSYASEKYIIGTDAGNVYHTSYETTSDYDPCEQYQWVDTGDTICYDGNRYRVEKQQHLVNGEWVDTGVQRHSDLIGADNTCIVTEWVMRGNTQVINGIEYFIEEEKRSTDGGVTYEWTGNIRNTNIIKSMVETSKVNCLFTPQYRAKEDQTGYEVSLDCGSTWIDYITFTVISQFDYLTGYTITWPSPSTWTEVNSIDEWISEAILYEAPAYHVTPPVSFADNKWSLYITDYNDAYVHDLRDHNSQSFYSSYNPGYVWVADNITSKENGGYLSVVRKNTSTRYSTTFRYGNLSSEYYSTSGLTTTFMPLFSGLTRIEDIDVSLAANIRKTFVVFNSKIDEFIAIDRFKDNTTNNIVYGVFNFTRNEYAIVKIKNIDV